MPSTAIEMVVDGTESFMAALAGAQLFLKYVHKLSVAGDCCLIDAT